MKNKLTALVLLVLFFTGVSFAQTPVAPANLATGVLLTTTNVTWTAFNEGPSANGPYDVQYYGTDGTYVTPVTSSAAQVGTSFTFGGPPLVANTTYYWRVRDADINDAELGLQAGTWHNFSFTTIIGPPTATAASLITPASFSANWTAHANGGATSYILDVGTAPGGTTIINSLNVGNVLTYSVTGLTANTTYYYKVRAFNGTHTSISSNEITTATLPPPPTIIAPSPSNYAVGITVLPSFAWSGVGTTYDFAIDDNSDFSSPVATQSGAGTSYSFSPYTTTASLVLSNGTLYYWRVRQTNANGTSSWVTREFTTVAAATPYISHTSVSGTSASIYWYPLPYATGLTYDLLYSTNANMTGFTTVAGLTNTNYTITGLTVGTTYYVQIKAKTNSGTVDIGFSTVTSFLIPGLPVPVPSYPTGGVTVYSNPPTVYWYTGSYYPGLEFEVRYGTSNTDIAPADGKMDTGTDLALTTNLYKTFPAALTAGTTYYWQVRSKSGANYSAWSSIESFVIYSSTPTTPVVPYLSWPVGGATVYTTQPSFYWYLGTYSTGLQFYFEYDNDSNLGSPSGNSGWITNLYYTLPTNLTGGNTYYWRVKSRLASAPFTESAWTTIESFVVANTASSLLAPYPVSPVGGTTVGTPLAGTTLTWSATGTGTLEFEVKISPYSSVDGTGMLNHPTVSTKTWATGTSTTTAGFTPPVTLVAGATYYWQVRARLQATPTTISAWSYVSTFSTAAGSFAVVPLIGSPNFGQPINNNSAVLSWVIPTISASPLTYDVEYSKNKDMSNSSVVRNLARPSAQITGLQNGTTYYWRALSKTNSGVSSDFSEVGFFKTNGITDVEHDVIPNEFALDQNYPNPFNPSTVISYKLQAASHVTLKVYDVLGSEVATLVDEYKKPGFYNSQFSIRNSQLSSGVYFYRLTAGSFVSVKKMLLIK
ncbi:MAG: fibronectin type III domain-containing protein [Bacteroidota bacterium]